MLLEYFIVCGSECGIEWLVVKEMVESDERTRRVEESGHDSLSSEEKGLGFGRDPSFSSWWDEDDVTRTSQLENNIVTEQALDFDLPLVQKNIPENDILSGMSNIQRSMEHGSDADDKSTNGVVNKNESYFSFDVENGDAIDKSYETGTSDSTRLDYKGTSRPNTKNPISVVDVLKTLFFILVWYTSSTILTLYNKTLLGDNMGKFPAPLLMNTVHFVMQAVLSNAITWFWSDRFHSSAMSWRDYFVRVVPTALSTALDVNLSNESLVFISVTFATMCKSAAPIFLLLFAFAFRLESPSVQLLGIIFIISAGVLLTVAKETEFEFWGFIFVMLAAVMSGFRWTMTQILLQKEVCVTSAVTVTIAGVVKEAVTILVAVFYFHDQFTWLKGLGLVTIMAGVGLFNGYKYQKLQKGEKNIHSPTEDGPSKYIILDEQDEEDTP